MRPLSLTLQAFGPYREPQTIDFEQVKDRPLFLITGPTGAGKTTLFDAMSFALFGETNGLLRTTDSLRSHFAPDDLLTQVTFSFRLKDLRYEVIRIPKQERPVSRGEGYTTQKAEATLTIYDKEGSKVYAGVTQVNQEVEKRLGLNAEQFRQIMMIPQGDFQRMLSADSKDREGVLRKLFDTELYRSIQTKLEQEAKTLFSQIKTSRTKRDTLIEQIKTGQEEVALLVQAEDKAWPLIREGLMAELVAEESRCQVVKEATDDLKKAQISLIQLVEQQDALVLTQNQLRQAQSGLVAHLHMEAEMAILAQGHKMSVEAENLRPLWQRLLEEESLLKQLEANERDLLEDKNQKKSDLAYHQEALDKVLSIDALTKRQEVSETKIQLNNLKPLMVKYEEAMRQEDQVNSKKKASEILLGEVKDQLHKVREMGQVIKEKLLERPLMDAANEELVVLSQVLGQMVKGAKNLKRLFLESYDLKEASIQHNLAYQHAKDAYDQDLLAYRQAKLVFLQNQAALLAQDLQEDLPCPVCGSTNHPSPAHYLGEVVSKDRVDELERLAETARNMLEKTSSELEILSVRLEGNNREIEHQGQALQDIMKEVAWQGLNPMSGHEPLSKWLVDLSQMMTLRKSGEEVHYDFESYLIRLLDMEKACHQEMTILSEKRRLLVEESKRLSDLEAQEVALTRELEAIAAKHEEEQEAWLEKAILVKQLKESLPSDCQSMESLVARIQVYEDEERKLLEAVEKARENERKSREDLIGLEATLVALDQRKADLLEQVAHQKAKLESQLESRGFKSLQGLESAFLSQENQAALARRLKEYEDTRLNLMARIQSFEDQLKDKEILDRDKLMEEKDDLARKIQEQEGLYAGLSERIKHNKALMISIDQVLEETKDQEKLYEVIGHIANMANGRNTYMLSFERYVLAAFLEDILVAANQRLHRMTMGRYQLERSEELRRANKQSGLELSVFDQYTGKSRHVTTLSGGESFKASLAMALGLSDVVQSYAGGVRLDTMFIDEGFGTLDEASLDQAINCLIDLQDSGRMVGIISHVQELKERIDTRLEIRADKNGSKAAFVMMA